MSANDLLINLSANLGPTSTVKGIARAAAFAMGARRVASSRVEISRCLLAEIAIKTAQQHFALCNPRKERARGLPVAPNCWRERLGSRADRISVIARPQTGIGSPAVCGPTTRQCVHQASRATTLVKEEPESVHPPLDDHTRQTHKRRLRRLRWHKDRARRREDLQPPTPCGGVGGWFAAFWLRLHAQQCSN